MKGILLVTLCLFSFKFVHAQNDFFLNVSNGINYSFHGHRDVEPVILEFTDTKQPIGFESNIGIEYSLGERHSIISGLGFSKLNIYPKQDLGFYYNIIFSTDNDTSFMSTPYLYKQSFQVLTLPLTIRRFLRKSNKVSFYFIVGSKIGFSIEEEEVYRENFHSSSRAENSIRGREIADSRKTFNLLYTAVQTGLGTHIRLGLNTQLSFEISSHLLEMRKARKGFIDTQPDLFRTYENWWNDSFLGIGQVAVEIGIRTKFFESK